MLGQWAYETDRRLSPWPLRVVAVTVVVLPVLGLFSFWGLHHYHGAAPQADSPQRASARPGIAPLVEEPGGQWHQYQRQQQHLLNSSAWQDRSAAIARVPVADAIDWFLEQQARQAGEEPQ